MWVTKDLLQDTSLFQELILKKIILYQELSYKLDGKCIFIKIDTKN